MILADHQLPVRQDTDAYLLSNLEELAIGYNPFKADQNRNSILDGAELARRCADVINQLPWKEDVKDPNQTYKWCMVQRGIETCEICGEIVNMGPAGIANPRLGLEVDCPLIAIHYMEHGSFSYQGDLRKGRIDVPALLRALEIRYPYEPDAHKLPLDYVVLVPLALDANDLDGDLLGDSEELDGGLNLYSYDQNANLVPDGVEFAKQCAAVIALLPVYQYNESGLAELHKNNVPRYFQTTTRQNIKPFQACQTSFGSGSNPVYFYHFNDLDSVVALSDRRQQCPPDLWQRI
jgi:hypothetical protein